MQSVDIMRNGALLATIFPDSNSTQVKRVMGENQVTITFSKSSYIPFRIGDYCTIFSERYQLNSLPVVIKESQVLWRYTLVMQAEMYDLAKAQMLFLGTDNTLREAEFSLMGKADDFIDLILQNVARVGSGWTKGQVIPTNYKNLTFSGDSCHEALARLAEEFNTEFWVEGKTIHLTERSADTGETFKHGRNKGLYQITRQNVNNSGVVTRLYAFGSEKNLPDTYISTKGKRLRLPAGYDPCLVTEVTCDLVNNLDGTTTFTFTWTAPLSAGVTSVLIDSRPADTTTAWTSNAGSATTPRSVTLPTGSYDFRFRTYGATCNAVATEIITIGADVTIPVLVPDPLPFIERNVNVYGVSEYTEIFDDIFPHRTGTITGVNAGDEHQFTDSSMDFNINSYLLPGLTPKITFNSGQLAGYTFDLESYNNSLKLFRIQQNGDERVLEIPSVDLRPAIGDEYVITDIRLPDEYIEAAEEELLAAAQARLIELSEPQLTYTVVIDPLFMKRFNKSIKAGDLVWIVDAELEVQRKIRVVAVTRNIVDEYNYQVELSDIVSKGLVNQLVASQVSTDRGLQQLDAATRNDSILNNKVIGTLTFVNLPTTNTYTGFSEVLIEDATGKLYRKV